MTERRRVMLLTLIVPWVALGVMFISLRAHGAFLKGLAGGFGIAMAILLVYVVSQMVKLKRGKR